MKKLLLSVLILLGLLGLAQGFGHAQYQRQLDQQLAQLAQQGQWQLKQQVDSSNWWQQSETWQLQGDLQQLGLAAQTVNLVIKQQVTFWPLWLSGQWQFDPSQGDYQSLLQQYQLAPPVHHGQWQANLVLQQLTQQFSLDAFQHQSAQVDVEVKALHIDMRSDLAMQGGTIQLNWQGMSLHERQQQGDFIAIGQFEASETFSQQQQWTLIEQASWHLAELSLRLRQADVQLNLAELRVHNQFNQAQQKAYLAIHGELGKLHFAEGERQFTIQQLRLNSQLGGVPMDQLHQLARLKQQTDSQPALDPLIQQIVAAGLNWQLDDLAFHIDSNYPQAPLQGDLKLSGLAKLLPFELSEVSSPLQVLRYLDLQLSVDASDQLFSHSPLAGYILALRQAGYLEHQAGRDQSQIIFNESEFTMNTLAVN